MTPEEVAGLMAIIAAYDYRTVGRTDVKLWHEAIGHLPFDDAREAVVRHHRDSTERINPGHITALCSKIRRERVEHWTPSDREAHEARIDAKVERMVRERQELNARKHAGRRIEARNPSTPFD